MTSSHLPQTRIFSVGHSDHPWPAFAKLVADNEIATVADVRSHPRSRFSHFNRDALRAKLKAMEVSYLSMGLELGGRPLDGSIPDYEEIATTPLFNFGIVRVLEIGSRSRMAILCSEHEPLTCHRCLLVGRALVERGASVEHILRDGRIEPHQQTEDRLLIATGQTESDLLASRDERLKTAYRKQAQRLWRTPAPKRPKPLSGRK